MYKELVIKIKELLFWNSKKITLSEEYLLKDQISRAKPFVKMGDIYYAYLGSNVGSEIDKERPVLVFQGDDRFMRRSSMVLIIPITSNLKPRPYKILINRGDIKNSLGITYGALLVQQMRSVSKMRLTNYKGSLSVMKLKEVALEINRFLYTNTPIPFEDGNAQTVSDDPAKVHSCECYSNDTKKVGDV